MILRKLLFLTNLDPCDSSKNKYYKESSVIVGTCVNVFLAGTKKSNRGWRRRIKKFSWSCLLQLKHLSGLKMSIHSGKQAVYANISTNFE